MGFLGSFRYGQPLIRSGSGLDYPSGFQRRRQASLRKQQGLIGPVAQLGERLVCIQEVVGSNPVGSTTPIEAEELRMLHPVHPGQAVSAGFPREQRGPGGTSRAKRAGGPPGQHRAYSSAWLERTPDKRKVGGSNPPRPTSSIRF